MLKAIPPTPPQWKLRMSSTRPFGGCSEPTEGSGCAGQIIPLWHIDYAGTEQRRSLLEGCRQHRAPLWPAERLGLVQEL